MEYADRWCMRCGRPCGECKHCEETTKKTEDAVEAARIRQIYQGIEVHWEKRKYK